MSEDKSEERDKCSICHEIIDGSLPLCKLGCAHKFHTRCILPWIIGHNTCPLCRVSPVPVDIYETRDLLLSRITEMKRNIEDCIEEFLNYLEIERYLSKND